jgi:hypothetical protein
MILCICVGVRTPVVLSLPAAKATKVLSINDTARLRFKSERGVQLLEEGPATGTLPGSVRARLTVGSTVSVGFTIYVRGGTISGQGYAKLNPGRGAYASFSGSLKVSHGGGKYAHASGSGGLFGTLNRENDNATVQVVGRLHL